MKESRYAVASVFYRALPALALVALTAAATWKLAFAGRIIARGDLLLYFYPLQEFAARTLHDGRLPLWNPYTFMGAPFLANSQAGVFYPLNRILGWLPVAQAVSLQIVLHLMLAGAGAYLFARRALSRPAAFASGLLFGLGGYLGAQVEHLNQLQVLAWLPWTLWAATSPRPMLQRIAALSALLALQITAGHTQSLYISCCALALVTLTMTFQRTRLRNSASTLALLALAVSLAALICAAQLLPTLELSRESYRAGGLPFNEAGAFSWRPWVIARALLPTYGDPLFPEYIAYLGAAGLALALLGALAPAASPAQKRSARVALILTGAGLLLALGIATPLFNVLYKVLPGFNLFRAPARWLALFALGAALLAGHGIEALRLRLTNASRRRWLIVWFALCLMLAAGAWLGARFSPEAEYQALPARLVLAGWALGALAITLTLLARRVHLVLGVLCVELLAASQFQPYARAADAQALTSLRPSVAHLRAEPEAGPLNGRVLALSGLFFDPGDKPEQELIHGQTLNSDEIYDRLIATKHKEVLSPNLPLYYGIPSVDGYDGGLLPTRRFVDYTKQFAGDAARDGRLREFLKGVPEMRWLREMGVRYVIADKTQDVFLDGVFYDLLFTTALTRPREISLTPYEGTQIGLVFGLPAPRPGEALGSLTLDFASGLSRAFAITTPAGAPADGFLSVLKWDAPDTPLTAHFIPSEPARGLALRGMTVIDGRDKTWRSQIASADALVRLAHSGDVKIYSIASRGWARAQLRGQPELAVALASTQPEALTATLPAPLTAPDVLLLRDGCYPGWVARVDGREIPIICDGLFRTVALPAGACQVAFIYAPRSVQYGLWLSGLGLLLFIALAGLALRQLLAQRPHQAAPSGAAPPDPARPRTTSPRAAGR